MDYAASTESQWLPNASAVAKAASAERLEHACCLLPGDADVIWTAAQPLKGTGL